MSCSLQKLFPKHFHLAGKYKKHPPAGTLWEQPPQSYLSSWQNSLAGRTASPGPAWL